MCVSGRTPPPCGLPGGCCTICACVTRMHAPGWAPETGVRVPQACLHPCPEERLSCAQLLQLPYFQGIEASLPADFRSARVRPALDSLSVAGGERVTRAR